MPYEELLKWVEFFNRRPVGWREDYRTYLFLRTQGVKESPENIFPSLKQLQKHESKRSEPDRAVPKGKFLDMLLKAKGGDGSKLK
jgi:hypothetical protein